MWAVFVSDPAGDKTGRKGCWTWTGHTGTKTDLFCDLEVGMLASLLAQERLDEQQVGRCKDHFSHRLAPYDWVHHQHLVQVYLVLEEDGTEVDDEEYFQTLPDNTMFMLLFMQVCF